MTTTSSISTLHTSSGSSFLIQTDTCLSPSRKAITSPLFGPSPKKRTYISGPIPNTRQRVLKRLKALEASEISDDAKKTIDKIQSTLFDRSTSKASSIPFEDLALGHKIKGKKRCYTFITLEIFDKSSLELLATKDFKELVFISSSIEQSSKRVIVIDPEALARKSPSKSITAIHDFHSERACLTWLDTNFSSIVREMKECEKIDLDDSKLININLFTKLSSCTKCASVFGSDNSPHRAADTLQIKLQRELHIETEFLPAITIVHQGLKHYHRTTRSSPEIPTPEFYHSSDLKG